MSESMDYFPEVQEDEKRIVRNDRLRSRRPRKTFRSKEIVNEKQWNGRVRKAIETRDEWMLGAHFVPLEEIVDPRTEVLPHLEVEES